MSHPRRLVVVACCKPGSPAATDLDALVLLLRGAGAMVELQCAEQPHALAAMAQRARDAAPDVAVAFGGDGTVNTVANALAGSAVALGIAPHGTFNYVAKQYALPEASEALAALLATGEARPIAAGEVNGKLFLNNCSFGLYTDVIEARERHKAAWGRYRVVAVVSALSTALRSRARMPLKLTDVDGKVHRHGRASLFFAGVNPRQFADSGFEIADAVEAGALGFVVVDAINPQRVLGMLVGALAGRVEQLQHISAFTDDALRVEIADRLRQRRRVKVVIDGELLHLQAPLELRYRPDALRLVMPAAATEPLAAERSITLRPAATA